MKRAILLTFSILMMTCAIAQLPKQSIIDTIQSYMDHQRSIQNAKGALLKIEKVGAWSYKWTSGVTDTVTNTPLAGNEKFRIGSLSKMFLATCVLNLVDEGFISLNDTIGKWLSPALVNVIPFGHSITVRQLLNHTSGMADPVDDPYSTILTRFYQDPFYRFNTDTIMFNDFPQLPPTNPPSDTLANYTNTGYWLLGKIVERVTSMGYDQYITEHIITPLGLTNTWIPSYSDSSISTPYMHGYGMNPVTEVMNDFSYQSISLPYSAGSIYSNFDDLNVFFKNLRNGNIIPMNWVDSMQNCHAHNMAKPSMYYGYGMFRVLYPPLGLDWYGHTGGIAGYCTYMFYMPSVNSYVICNFSSEEASPQILYQQITAYLQSIEGIEGPSDDLSLKISPNPASGKIEITGIKKGTIEIIDLFGSVVRSVAISGDKTIVNVSGLADGVYVIKANTGNGTAIKKFVKE